MEPNNPAYSVGTTLVFPVEEILVTGFAPAGWDSPLFDAHPMSIIIFGDENRGDAPDFSLLAASLGFRILKGGPIATARSRMNELVDVDAILVRCTGAEPELNDALARFDMMAQTHGTRLIVIVGLDGLDAVISVISSADATILCQPDFADIVVALMGAQSRAGTGDLLRDIGSGDGDARLEHLSSQIARLNQTIETLVRNKFVDRLPSSLEKAQQENSLRSAGRGYASMPPGDDTDRPALTSHQIRSLLRARRLRDHLVVADLFADPAWDIMLDLMAARLERAQVSVSSLCIAAAVPPTTALRWIHQLTDRGLLERQDDPNDGRRIFIALSDEGADAVQRWFRDSRPYLMAALGLADS